tara:strand:- start:1191 stop:1559 length:369 start_codon:yes stop_codon:yes gene_type:complete
MACIVCSTGPFKPAVNISSRKSVESKKAILQVAEKLNGRLAMQGVTWGAINQFVLHEGGVQQQLQDPHNVMTVAAVTALVSLGTSVTQNDDHERYFAWTPEAELLNGRVAMLAMVVATVFNI